MFVILDMLLFLFFFWDVFFGLEIFLIVEFVIFFENFDEYVNVDYIE